MLVVNPETIGQWGERKLMSGFLQCQQAKLVQALESANHPIAGETLAQAVHFIRESTGVDFTTGQLTRLLDLYPFARSALADNCWRHPDSEHVVLDVLANSLLCSRWPTQLDQTDLQAFLHNLRFAAKEFGYNTV